MEPIENNNALLLLKTGNSLKSLVQFSESLQEENEQLKRELQNAHLSKQDEITVLSNKYSDLLKKKQELEMELSSSSVLHEQRIRELENDKLYLQQELTALQHLCESKEKEITSLNTQLSSNTNHTTPTPSLDLSEQLSYIDSKLQKVLKHVYEVRAECEQTESKVCESTQYTQTLTQNIQILYSILIEAISFIVELQSENTNQSIDSSSPPPPQKEIQPEEEVIIREYSLTSLEYQFTSFETRIKALQECIDQQKREIESLQNQNTHVCEQITPAFTSFDDALALIQESMNERIKLLEEENRLLKTQQCSQPVKHTEGVESDKQTKEEGVTTNTQEEHCRKCNDVAYGFMISCCKCNACFHVSCVISKNENISDLLKKKKQFVCGMCKK